MGKYPNHLLGRGAPTGFNSLQVKNTFIDISNCEEGDADIDDQDVLGTSFWPRQVSEPVPRVQRQTSWQRGADVRFLPVDALRTDGFSEEEELKEAELREPKGEESETETEPSWLLGQATFQETDPACPAFAIGRQETEQRWPSWGAHDGTAACLSSEQVADPVAGNEWPVGAVMHDLANGDGVLPPGEPSAAAWGPWAMGLAAPYPDAKDAGIMPSVAGIVANGHHMGDAMVKPFEWDNVTTVMMRNLPNKYSQQMLLEDLNQSGFMGMFDFMYLPIDGETHANRGYAFINFTSPSLAWMLRTTFEGQKMPRFNSDKVVSVSPAALQGFEANYAHYYTARVNRGDPATRPLFLRETSTRQFIPRNDGHRRRGRGRAATSLVDRAARQQQQQAGMASAGVAWKQPQAHTSFGLIKASAIGLKGSPPSHVSSGGASLQFQDERSPFRAVKAAGPAQQQAVARFCPYCGAKFQPGSKFCWSCGGSLNLVA